MPCQTQTFVFQRSELEAAIRAAVGLAAERFAGQAVQAAEVAECVGATLCDKLMATPPRPDFPAVPIEQSVTSDFVVCLEDGSKHKMMKRYLRRVFHLSPDEYRARWGLEQDYPMAAPGYSEQKRKEAKAVRLGTTENKTGRGARSATRAAEMAAAALPALSAGECLDIHP